MQTRGKRVLTLALLGLTVATAITFAGCSRPEGMEGQVELFSKLIKPNFYAHTETGELIASEGTPSLILEWQGKATIQLRAKDGNLYLDPIAVESKLVGEHPRQKVVRLQRNLGIPIEAGLSKKLAKQADSQNLFHRITFEYLPGKEATGTISEVFPDGTFLVIPDKLPDEWLSTRPGVKSPTHFHVDSRGLISKTSTLAREFEEEILKLPFDQQREPPVNLSQKACQFYYEAETSQVYRDVLASVGFQMPSGNTTNQTAPGSLYEGAFKMVRSEFGEDKIYFGSSGYGIAERLISLGLEGLERCDGIRGMRKLEDDLYWVVWRSLEPDRKDRNIVQRTDSQGRDPQVVYVAPGLLLMALPVKRQDATYLLLSAEGWKAASADAPPDPRWQSVYLVNLDKPGQYELLAYPLPPNRGYQGQGKLYGHSALVTGDGSFLYALLYGFEDEGGGFWAADLKDDEFAGNKKAFARIVPWDHALSWIILNRQVDLSSRKTLSVFLTGKEVGQGFAMTANHLRIRLDGTQSLVKSKKRLMKMVGWNPVPFSLQHLSDREHLVLVETHYNYENSLLDRAKGVFIVSVKE